MPDDDLGTLDDLGLDAQDDDSPETSPEPTKMVEAKRLNALMAKHQRVLDENKRLKALVDSSSTADPKEVEMPDAPPEFMQQFQAMAEKVADMQLERARTKALKEHPEAEAFIDMVVGSTEEEVMDAAKQVAERVKAGRPPAPDPTEGEPEGDKPEATKAAPVSGGAVAGPTEPDLDDEIAEARKNRDWTGYLRLKYKQAGVEV